MLVMKFGGTSVGSAQRFAEVSRIVEQVDDEECVVVVSEARAELLAKHLDAIDDLLGNTPERDPLVEHVQKRLSAYERLCDSISTLGELTMRGHDAVASIGEELSSRILAALLRTRGHRAQAVSATTLVRTDDHYGAATPDMDETTKLVSQHLRPLVKEGVLPIVTGYIGATGRGVTTTLGRGGSDYSAAILGVCLDADEVWVWTDVDGILTADPKLVPDAHTLPELSYLEAEELAYFGADVLHPRTVAPLAAQGIRLRILNSFKPDHPGTLIVPSPDAQRRPMPAIISTEGLSLIEVAGNDSSWSLQMASRALRCLADAGIEVFMFSQSFSERNLNLVLRCQDQVHSVHLLKREFEADLRLGKLLHIGAQEQVAAVSIVGMPGAHATAIAPQAFAALGKLGLRVISIAQTTSAYSVSFIIAEGDIARAVPFIHHELGL